MAKKAESRSDEMRRFAKEYVAYQKQRDFEERYFLRGWALSVRSRKEEARLDFDNFKPQPDE